jgi:Ni/Co efflux regulator RcnB
MRPLIFATLAMSWLAAPALAQPQAENGAATVERTAQDTLAGTHTNQTSGGDADNPAPHIYKRGEHISPSYGSFDPVTDWSHFHLKKPQEGYRWVKFGDNFLLVSEMSGLITDIVKAS